MRGRRRGEPQRPFDRAAVERVLKEHAFKRNLRQRGAKIVTWIDTECPAYIEIFDEGGWWYEGPGGGTMVMPDSSDPTDIGWLIDMIAHGRKTADRARWRYVMRAFVSQ